VHVRVTVNGHLKEFLGPDGSHSYDCTVVCSITLVFFDTSEGETNATLTDPDIELALGESHTMPYNLVSNDPLPERSSGSVTVRNVSPYWYESLHVT
jgi:hypothetical protein